MATKTITIKEEVYNSLIKLKRENESFSDLLLRLTQNVSTLKILNSIQGTLDLGDTDSLLEEISERRRNWK